MRLWRPDGPDIIVTATMRVLPLLPDAAFQLIYIDPFNFGRMQARQAMKPFSPHRYPVG